MSLVVIDWNPNRAKLRSFGISMLVGFGVIGGLAASGLLSSAGWKIAAICWIFGLSAGLTGISGSKAALPLYWFWMGIAFVLGNVMSRVLLVLFFYLLVTPVGLLGRLLGRDVLQLNGGERASFWLPIKKVTSNNQYVQKY